MENKILFTSFLVFDIRKYILWCVSVLLSPILIYNLYFYFTILKFIIFFPILFILLFYFLQQKVYVYTNHEIKFYHYILGLKIFRFKKKSKISYLYIFRRNSSSIVENSENNGNFSNSESNMLQPDIVLQVFDNMKNIIFEILTDDEMKTTELALQLSKIFEVNIFDYRKREMEIYKYNK